jgi:hypothetical protein
MDIFFNFGLMVKTNKSLELVIREVVLIYEYIVNVPAQLLSNIACMSSIINIATVRNF